MAEITSNDNVTVQDILDGKKELLSLDFATPHDREIAVRCMDKNQLLSRQLDIGNPDQLETLKLWVAKKYANLLILTSQQRCKELIDIFLEGKLQQQLDQLKESDPLKNSVSIIHSYTKQQLICYNYETKEGEAVSYFDNKLGIPVKLKTEASVKLKVLDSLKLVKKIDIELERVDLTITVNLINNIIAEYLRETLLEIVDVQKVSYYDLPRYFAVIRDSLQSRLQVAFGAYGLEISDLKINDIYLLNDIDKHLESQYFALAKIARVKEFEYKLEEQSLKLYEKKASIHAAYPDFQVGLTEAEKDLALERYLKRIGQDKEVEVNVNEEVLDDRYRENTDAVTTAKINAPVKPQKYVSSKKCRIWYGIAAALWAVLTVIFNVLGNDFATIGIIIGVVGAIGLAVVGILLRYQLRYGVSKAVKEEYDQKMETYRKNLKAYQDNAAASKLAQDEATATIEDNESAAVADSFGE